MQRRHFEAIAAVIKASTAEEVRLHQAGRVTDAEHVAAWEALTELTRNMANTLKGFNPNFDRERFVKACGFDD